METSPNPNFPTTRQRLAEYVAAFLLSASGVVLIALQLHLAGWILLGTTTVSLVFTRRPFAKDVMLVVVGLTILGLTPINTDIGFGHMMLMGATLALAVAIPYVISRFVYRDYLVRFPFHHGRRWFRSEVLWIFGTALVAYFLLPFYLRSTGAYLNWTVEPGAGYLGTLFIGTNGLGIWDELFFVSTVLGILRRYFPFHFANLVQAVLFTSFLYELGFTGWGPYMIYPFALIQGLVFRKTESLLYVITIHLTYDLILYLALIHAHRPDWLGFFIT